METSNELKEDNVSRFEKVGKYIAWIVPALGLLYAVASYAYSYFFATDCEKFYTLPKEYFSININEKLILPLLLLLLFVTIVYLIRNQRNVLMTIGCGFAFTLYAMIFILNLIPKISWLYNWVYNLNIFFCIFILFIIPFLAELMITYVIVFPKDFSNGKFKTWKLIGLIFALILNFIILLPALVYQIGYSIDKKTNYEFISYNQENLVILSNLDNNTALVSNYIICDNDKYVFYTKDYKIIDKKDLPISYIDIQHPPTIKDEKKCDDTTPTQIN